MARLSLIALVAVLVPLFANPAPGAQMMSDEDLIHMTDSYLDVKDIEGLIEFADGLHALFDYESLLVVTRHAYDKLPQDQPQLRGFALRGIAESYEGLKQYDRAITTYRQTIQQHPDSAQAPWCQLGVGRSLIGLGRYDEAITELRRVVEKWPNTTAAAWAEEQIGYAYLGQGKPQEALTYIKRALYNYAPEKHPREMGFPSLKYLRIEIAVPHLHQAYVEAGDDAAALEEFTKLQHVDDVGRTAFYYLAVHHQRLGQYDHAIDLFTQYIELPEQFFKRADAYFNRAMCHFAKGEYDQAIAGWREVAASFPLHYLAEESVTWIKIAEERKRG